MCTLALVWQTHPDYPLLLASNRDEFLQRPTQVASIWPENPNFIGGKDLEAGGSWLLATPKGRWAVLTNYRDGRNLAAGEISRGELVKEAVQLPLADVEPWLVANKDKFAGYNLLWGTKEEAWYFTNAGEQANLGVQTLAAGIHTLSNANLNTPWFKTQLLKTSLQTWLNQPKDKQSLQDIFNLLANRQQADANQLPNTYISQQMEQLLSSLHIVSKDYATRCATLLTVNLQNQWKLQEKTFHYPSSTHNQSSTQVTLSFPKVK